MKKTIKIYVDTEAEDRLIFEKFKIICGEQFKSYELNVSGEETLEHKI
jgi:hypothetical protein